MTTQSLAEALARVRPMRWLALLLLTSVALRMALVWQGGQLFSPDELRYALRPVKLADTLYTGDIGGAVDGMLRYREHHGFVAVGLVPAWIHRLVYALDPDPNMTWREHWLQPMSDFRVSAALLSLVSVACVAMQYALSRQAGGSHAEALLAALLLAASTTFFLFSRHFMPIDAPMLAAQLGMLLALRWRDRGSARGVVVGALAFSVVWIYHGYVTLAAAVGLLYGLLLARDLRQAMLRGLAMALGGALIFLPVLLYNTLVLDIDMIQEMRWFSHTVTLGSYAEGWLFPFLYLGDVESGVALAWLAGMGLGARRLCVGRGVDAGWRRGFMWLCALAALYLLMALLSTGLERFVLYGRIARALAPFAALFAAWGLAPILSRHRQGGAAFVALVCLLAAANFIPVFQLQHPREFARQVYADYNDVSFETTFRSGTHGFLLDELPDARYKLVNASFYYPVTEMDARPDGEVLLEAPHPFNHRLWQYEGMTPDMREIVRRDPVMMWLIDTKPEVEEGSESP